MVIKVVGGYESNTKNINTKISISSIKTQPNNAIKIEDKTTMLNIFNKNRIGPFLHLLKIPKIVVTSLTH